MMSERVHRRIRVVAALVIVSSAPVVFKHGTVQFNNACAGSFADGYCCPAEAVCFVNGVGYAGHFFSSKSCVN